MLKRISLVLLLAILLVLTIPDAFAYDASLEQGLNLIAPSADIKDLDELAGILGNVKSIDYYEGSFKTFPQSNSVIIPGKAYLVNLKANASINFNENLVYPVIYMTSGVNLIGIT